MSDLQNPFDKGPTDSDRSAINPYAPYVETSAPDDLDAEVAIANVGIGRGIYFGLIFGIGFIQEFLEESAGSNGNTLGIIPTLIGLIVTLWVTSLRLQNMGYTGRWCLALLIPIFNLFIFLKCLGCPAGYAVHKKLDTTAWVLLAVLLGLLLVSVASLFLEV